MRRGWTPLATQDDPPAQAAASGGGGREDRRGGGKEEGAPGSAAEGEEGRQWQAQHEPGGKQPRGAQQLLGGSASGGDAAARGSQQVRLRIRVRGQGGDGSGEGGRGGTAGTAGAQALPPPLVSKAACPKGKLHPAELTPKELDLQRQRKAALEAAGVRPPGGELAICLVVKGASPLRLCMLCCRLAGGMWNALEPAPASDVLSSQLSGIACVSFLCCCRPTQGPARVA